MKYLKSALFTVVLTGGCLALNSLAAQEVTKRSIDTIMEEAMKGTNSLHRKVSLGQASEEEAKLLLDYFKSLQAEKPSKGDAASWEEKTAKLVAAAQGVIDKKPNATTELQTAGNCKACHNVHK